MNKKTLTWASLILAGAIIVCILYISLNGKESVPEATPIEEVIKNVVEKVPEKTTTPETKTAEKEPSKTLPSQLNLDAPFYSQAPLGDWSYPWQEACEEASILLVANVYSKHNWSRDEFNSEILKMVEWEKGKFGTYLDTTVAQTAEILNEYLKLKTITHENPTYDDVVEIINK